MRKSSADEYIDRLIKNDNVDYTVHDNLVLLVKKVAQECSYLVEEYVDLYNFYRADSKINEHFGLE